MIKDVGIDYDEVLRILYSEGHQLRELVYLVGKDPLKYYRGADLTNLDLSNQNLTGMNFDNADLRFSNLENISFDTGAFNRAILSNDQSWVKDDYDLSVDDIVNHDNNFLMLFIRFRRHVIDDIINGLEFNYKMFGERAQVSTNAVRKARRGETVAHQTAVNILQAIDYLRHKENTFLLKPGHIELVDSLLTQPLAMFVSGGINGNFDNISREDASNYRKLKHDMIDFIKSTNLNTGFIADYRETPEALIGRVSYYMRYHQFAGWSALDIS